MAGAAEEAASVLAAFVADQPGAARPISDRWAVSLIPAASLLRANNAETLVSWLERVVVWVCDRDEDHNGLAAPAASPTEEVLHLLGEPYEHIAERRRRSSYVATVILDLASTLELPDLYRDAFNDFAAVGDALPSIEPLDEPGQYHHAETGVMAEANIDFESEPSTSGWHNAVHHRRAPESHELDGLGRSWELLATARLLRNRHFLPTTRILAGLDLPPTG